MGTFVLMWLKGFRAILARNPVSRKPLPGSLLGSPAGAPPLGGGPPVCWC